MNTSLSKKLRLIYFGWVIFVSALSSTSQASSFADGVFALKDLQTTSLNLREGSCNGPVLADFKKTKVASAATTREKGLSGRKKLLAENEGMLFVFNPPQSANFWMKNTYIPLGILFFKADGTVSKDYVMRPEDNPVEPKMMYPAPEPIVAAIEIAPDWIKKLSTKMTLVRACLK